MLTVDGCLTRQERLRAILDSKGADGALITNREHVYYYTGFRCHWNHCSAAWIEAEGKTTVIGFRVPEDTAAADDIRSYDAKKTSTMLMDQAHEASKVLADCIPPGSKMAADCSGATALIQAARAAAKEKFFEDITHDIYRSRKRKDPDELAILKRAIAVSEVMHQTVKDGVEPGKNEMDLFAELRAAATLAAGQDCERFGNDFRAAARGGAPRDRKMNAGELFILDAGPSLEGYHADNARTFAVDGKGTEVQHEAYQKIVDCLSFMEGKVKPGVKGNELFEDAKAFLADTHGGLTHHLGHGIGLSPHEAPQLNPDFDAVMEAGDVFTMEPGLYSDELNAGIRLEQNYLLTNDGFERLTKFPLGL